MRPNTRSRTVFAWLVSSALAALITLPFHGIPADAQNSGRLDLIAQTTWIGDSPAAIDLRITGAPGDARLAVRVLAPVTTRSAVIATFQRPMPDSSLLADFEVTDLDAARVGSGEVVSVVMPDEEIGLLLRRDPGALTVIIDLMSQDIVLDTLITHFLVAAESPLGADIGVAMVYDMRQPLATSADLEIVTDPESVNDHVDFLSARARLPIGVRINGETLEALSTTTESMVDSPLGQALAGRELLLEPWVDLDEEAWRAAGEPDTVINHYAAGRRSVDEVLHQSQSGIVQLDDDSTPITVSLLRSAGAVGLVVNPELVSTNARNRRHPVTVLDSNGVAIKALVLDHLLMTTLGGPDPELAGQHAVVELALEAMSLESDGVVVIDATHIDSVALDVLYEGIAATPNLTPVTLSDALRSDIDRTSAGIVTRATLRPLAVPDYAAAAADLDFTKSAISSYASMVPHNDAPIAPLRRLVEVAPSSYLQPVGMSDYTARVLDAIDTGTKGIEVIEGDRVTLASRSADLPLVIRNDQTLQITVDLFLRSEKLRFPDGDHQVLLLAPGDNEITVRVQAPTSGDARVTATLSSPDGRIELARGTLNVRSTAISGLGLTISLISLAVLLTWWARTILRVRRNRSDDSFSASTTDDEESPADPQEGNS